MKKITITFGILILWILFFYNFALAQIQQPSINILAPLGGDVYEEEVIEFLFSTENFTFVDYKNNSIPFPGNSNAGHAHLWIEPPADDLNPDVVFEVRSPDIQNLNALKPGRYTATIELVQNHHVIFEPRVFETVKFRVRGDGSVTGKYVITKTENIDDVGKPPREPINLFRTLIVIILILGILIITFFFQGYLQKNKYITFTKKKLLVFVNKIHGKIVNTKNSKGIKKVINSAKKIYGKSRRKN